MDKSKFLQKDVIPTLAALAQGGNGSNKPFDPVQAILKYRIDLDAEIMEPPILIEINHSPIATLGNFSLIIGKAKSRKTFFVSCLTSAAAVGSCSIEGIRGVLRAGANKILYFDTEQAPFHAQRTARRICKQIGVDQPSNFQPYELRPLEPKERWQTIEHAISTTPGLALVVIDGIVDLLSRGINDEEEAIKLTSTFLRWTQQYNIHIIAVLHQNKGDFNARGHIGTSLVNKAESVLSITKDAKAQDLSIVKAEYCRDRDFKPFAFSITDEGLPVVVDAPPAEDGSLIKIRNTFEAILIPPRSMRYNQLKIEYMERSAAAERTAKNHIKKAIDNQIIIKDEKNDSYRLFQMFSQDDEAPF